MRQTNTAFLSHFPIPAQAPRQANNYLRVYSWMNDLLPRDGGKHRRRRHVLAALLYRAQAFGARFQRQLAQLVQDVHDYDYCRRTIVTALQELRKLGMIDYRSDGRGLWITIAPALFARIRKCKQCNALNNKDLNKKPQDRAYPSYRPKPAYVPYLVSYEGRLSMDGAVSYDDYRQECEKANKIPMAIEDWIKG